MGDWRLEMGRAEAEFRGRRSEVGGRRIRSLTGIHGFAPSLPPSYLLSPICYLLSSIFYILYPNLTEKPTDQRYQHPGALVPAAELLDPGGEDAQLFCFRSR